MSIVRYNIDSLNEMKLKISQCNSQILSDLKLFDNELRDIYQVLSTPKSSKVIPKFIEYFIAEENYINEYNTKTDKLLGDIIEQYKNSIESISLMVGEKNE